MPIHERQLEVLIIGGGIAGLWTLSELRRAGVSAALIEASALGAGQTIWSQGIIHGGLKYTLAGLMNPSARAVREMPDLWRACLSNQRAPALGPGCLRAPHCHLWRTDSLASRAGMIGARLGLRTAPVVLEPHERPDALRRCPGVVARLEEPVIDPAAVLRALARDNERAILAGDVTDLRRQPDHVVALVTDRQRDQWRFHATRLLLTAGNGTPALRAMLDLPATATQVRPLRMVMARGPLPALFGHCVDGNATRVTITSAHNNSGTTVWQVGGALAERGPALDPADLLTLARRELDDTIPGLDWAGVEWSWYDAPRAEAATPSGARPETEVVLEEGPVLSAWPTKLALAPRLASRVLSLVRERRSAHAAPSTTSEPFEFPLAPPVPAALAPWDEPRPWATVID